MPIRSARGQVVGVAQAINRTQSGDSSLPWGDDTAAGIAEWDGAAAPEGGPRSPRSPRASGTRGGLTLSVEAKSRITAVPLSPSFRGRKFYSFTKDDEEILAAICAELSTVFRRYQTALAQFNSYGKEDDLLPGVQSPTGIVLRAFPWPDIKASELNELNSLDFDAFAYTPDQLLVFSYKIFEEFNFISDFRIPVESLKNFLLQVRIHYRENPFHNFHHGRSLSIN
jgi:hypothetical protein